MPLPRCSGQTAVSVFGKTTALGKRLAVGVPIWLCTAFVQCEVSSSPHTSGSRYRLKSRQIHLEISNETSSGCDSRCLGYACAGDGNHPNADIPYGWRRSEDYAD